MVQSKRKSTVRTISEEAEVTDTPDVTNHGKVTNSRTGRIRGTTDRGGIIIEGKGGAGSVKDESSKRKPLAGIAVSSVRETPQASTRATSKNRKEKGPKEKLAVQQRPSQIKKDRSKYLDCTRSGIHEEEISTGDENSEIPLRSCDKSKNIKAKGAEKTLTIRWPLSRKKKELEDLKSKIHEKKILTAYDDLQVPLPDCNISKNSKKKNSNGTLTDQQPITQTEDVSKQCIDGIRSEVYQQKMLLRMGSISKKSKSSHSPNSKLHIHSPNCKKTRRKMLTLDIQYPNTPGITAKCTDLTSLEPPIGVRDILYSNELPPLPLHMQTHPDQHLADRGCSRYTESFLRSSDVNKLLPSDKKRIRLHESFYLDEYESWPNKNALENEWEKQHLPNCHCGSCIWLSKIKKIAELKEPPSVRDETHVYQVKCICPNAANARRASKIPIPTNSAAAAPKAKPCYCDVCGCSPCSDPTKSKPEEAAKSADKCDCKDCKCEDCQYKPKEPEGAPSNKDCCCKGECTCQICPIDTLKATIQEAASKMSFGPKPEDCDCIECVCPNSTSRIGTAALQAKDSKKSSESNPEDCECEECDCPDSKSKVGKGRGDQPQNPPGCDCPICDCPGAKPEEPPPRQVVCDCDDCRCSPCSDPNRRKSVGRGPTAIAACDCPDCQCKPCADPAKAKGTGDAGESCDCEVCACADQIQTCDCAVGCTDNKSTHPPDCICDECLCDTEKHEKGCVCPECRCADCYYKKEDKCNCADVCLCDPCAYKETKAVPEETLTCTCGDCTCIDCAKLKTDADTCGVKDAGAGPGDSEVCHCDDCKCIDCAAKAKGEGKKPSEDEPPLFEVPVRIACTCNNCSCPECNKEGFAALPAGSVRPATEEAPPFRIPVRVPCRCAKCECEDCSKGGVEPSANILCACPKCLCAIVDSKGIQSVKDDIDKGLQVGEQCDCPPEPCMCLDETDVSKLNDNELRKQIQSDQLENSECRQQINDIRKALDKLERICNGDASPNQQYTQNKPFVKKASEFAQTMSGLKLALLNLQNKCKAKDNMINAMNDELKLRTSSNTFDKIFDNEGVEDPVDYDKADDARSPPRKNDRAPENEREIASTKVRRNSASKGDKKKSKVCKCGRTHKSKESSKIVTDMDLTGFEVTDIHRVTEDSIFINWKLPKINSIKGYNIFINDVNKSKVMSGARTTAMIHGLDLSATINISIYAVTKRGQCVPPATAIYEVKH